MSPVAQNHKKNVNDAKLRAVDQRVPTYDDFHQMVLGADLKPMEKRNKGKVSMFEGLSVEKKSQYFGSDLYQQSARAQRFGAAPAAADGGGDDADAAAGGAEGAFALPRNAMEFTREWQKSCRTSAAQVRYLAALPPRSEWWGSVFKSGIDVAILGQMFRCWAEGWAEGAAATRPEGLSEVHSVAQALVGLATTSRYELNLSLMCSDELDSLRLLCSSVSRALQDEAAAAEGPAAQALEQLRAHYGAYLEDAAGAAAAAPMAE